MDLTPNHRDGEYLHDRYIVRGWTTTKIAEECGVSHVAVLRGMKAAGIERRSRGPAVDPRLADRDWLDEQYTTNRRSIADLAAEIGMADSNVHAALRRHGIKTRSASEKVNPRVKKFPQLYDRDWLDNAYTVERQNVAEIAAALGCSGGAVSNALNRFEIPTRCARGTGAA